MIVQSAAKTHPGLESSTRAPSRTQPAPYRRYTIPTKPLADLIPHPHRFRVAVKRHRLALLLLQELIHYRGNWPVILSRPCLYGVFSGPVGGFAPREHLCVGCLRCTIQYPQVVQIYPHPARMKLGDSYLVPELVDTLHYEAQTGRIPVKGAGYRGRFGGEGWDGMWTDMSEIVRPTRDGIHGREFISTVVDIGGAPSFLTPEMLNPLNEAPITGFSIPLPIVFDVPPASAISQTLCAILSQAARDCETLALLPLSAIIRFKVQTCRRHVSTLRGAHLVPLVTPQECEYGLDRISFAPRLIEMVEWDERLYARLRSRFPQAVLALRLKFGPALPRRLLHSFEAGVRVFHLTADYHGRGEDGRFVLDWIREAHRTFVEAGRRDEVTLLGSGGIVAAEHVPKAIICGLDAVALDTALLVALQARFQGECRDAATSRIALPRTLNVEWGTQRLKNLLASWRDQLLEVLGAMGLREVRRLRGEIGRAMFQADLEREAWHAIGGIEGYGYRL